MKKLFSLVGLKKYWSFDSEGVSVIDSSEKSCKTNWNTITKIVFVDYFEEYSGYFLTDDYLEKKTYSDIKIDCSKNEVRIRTGSSPVLKRNMTNAFKTKHGTTCVKGAVFIEYLNESGDKFLYAQHFNKSKKNEELEEVKKYLASENIHKKTRVDGFSHLSSI